MKPKDWRPTSFVDTAPGAASDEDSTRIEQRRALYDLLRRLMTLDAAALIVVALLVEKVFVPPMHRIAVGAAVGSFFVSLFFGCVTYLVLLANASLASELRMQPGDRRAFGAAALITVLGFLAGMGALAWFFLVNWFR